jgi:hypothetical protein
MNGMRTGTRVAVGTVAALTALSLAGLAPAAYTSPKLAVSYGPGSTTRIVATVSATDDATARAAIVVPAGTSLTATAGPGTKVGTARADVTAVALGGARLSLSGDIVVAPAGTIPATQAQCTQDVTPQATMLIVLQAVGRSINLPAYLLPTTGALTALGPAQLVICLPPPDLPADAGGAPFGVKFVRADLSLNGVIGPVTLGVWTALWTPWNPGAGTPNTASTVASPAAISPGAITLSGRKANGVRRLAGRVTQGQLGVATRVAILAGATRIATVSSSASGSFAYVVPRTSKARVFRASAVVASRPAPPVCSQLVALGSLGLQCVNPTVGGFTATSGVVRLR